MIANFPVPATAYRIIDEKQGKCIPCETKVAKKTALAKKSEVTQCGFRPQILER